MMRKPPNCWLSGTRTSNLGVGQGHKSAIFPTKKSLIWMVMMVWQCNWHDLRKKSKKSFLSDKMAVGPRLLGLDGTSQLAIFEGQDSETYMHSLSEYPLPMEDNLTLWTNSFTLLGRNQNLIEFVKTSRYIDIQALRSGSEVERGQYKVLASPPPPIASTNFSSYAPPFLPIHKRYWLSIESPIFLLSLAHLAFLFQLSGFIGS